MFLGTVYAEINEEKKINILSMDLLLCNYSTTVANIKRIKNAPRLHVWVLRLTQVYTDLLGHNLSYNIKPKI